MVLRVASWFRVASLATALLGLAGLTPACKPADAHEDGEGESEVRTAVATQPVRKGNIKAQITATSTIEAERAVTVHAESTGRLVALAVDEGDAVTEGQLVARIKADTQAAGLDRARTNLDKARRDLDVVQTLFAQQVASKDELDAARLAYETASLDVRDRKRDVRNAKVTSPLAGIVTQRFVDEDSFVTAGQQLIAITDFDTLVARVFIPEKQLDEIAQGQVAQVVGKAARGRSGRGVVKSIAPVVDAATGTVKVTVALDPSEERAKGFLPGMYTEVTLTTDEHEDVLLVPRRALIRKDGRVSVFVAHGERAVRQTVAIGLEVDDVAEVAEGLSEGDEVIVAGQAGLRDGALIERTPSE